MQNLHIRGRLAFGLLLGLAAALPLACSDSDGDDGAAGHGGTGGTAQGGKGGQGGKSGSAGAPQGGKGGGTANAGTGAGGSSGGVGLAGSDQGGAEDMGGAGGAMSGAGDTGMAGDDGMAGAGGAGPSLAELVDALCTTSSTLDCDSGVDQAGEKATCVDSSNGQADFYATNCGSEVTALLTCLAGTPATGFECHDMLAYAKSTTCVDQQTALNNCNP